MNPNVIKMDDQFDSFGEPLASKLKALSRIEIVAKEAQIPYVFILINDFLSGKLDPKTIPFLAKAPERVDEFKRNVEVLFS